DTKTTHISYTTLFRSNFDGQSEATVTTDSDGRAAVVLTLGPDGGFDNNVVGATFSNNPGSAATFTASGKIVGEPADTKISGVVRSEEHTSELQSRFDI